MRNNRDSREISLQRRRSADLLLPTDGPRYSTTREIHSLRYLSCALGWFNCFKDVLRANWAAFASGDR